jgi:ppGpp synthetase/RelA/SpoT-type nucleotidyltranferase
MSEPANESPLAEVVRDRRINAILEAIRLAIRSHQPLVIEPKDVHYIQRSFQKGLSLGEFKLYELTRQLLAQLAPERPVLITLVTWARCPKVGHEEIEVMEVDLSKTPEKLTTVNDTLLGDSYRPLCKECGNKMNTVASFVRHHPVMEPNKTAYVDFIQTRIKTTSNICYKIADLVFDIDFMFQRDKIYNEFSQIVTDIYGIKIVTAQNDFIPKVVETFRTLPQTSVVNEKNYLGENRKKSGYEAFKMILKRERQLFEAQIQTKAMWETEKTSHAASHKTYKERQMADRNKLGKEYVELYRALSQLFSSPEGDYCSIDYIEIGQTSKGLDDEF